MSESAVYISDDYVLAISWRTIEPHEEHLGYAWWLFPRDEPIPWEQLDDSLMDNIEHMYRDIPKDRELDVTLGVVTHRVYDPVPDAVTAVMMGHGDFFKLTQNLHRLCVEESKDE